MKLYQPVKGELNYDGVISQLFGVCEEPVCSQYKKMGLDGHNGIDFRGHRGLPIFAAHDGKVVSAQKFNSITGNGVKILDKNKRFTTLYCHLDSIDVSVGENVIRGQTIGKMGNSGSDYYQMAVHLHFGLYETNEKGITINTDNGFKGAINPLPFFVKEDMKYVIIGKEQYLLDECFKLAFNIGDEQELFKLRQQGLAGDPNPLSCLPEGYLVYPLVDRNRLKDIFGL